ncbi:STAS domain-containing protein [Geofilum sp. OHC36d9]|uniref:STAS domain-containing protein n=1 Tax=Geofilum sp. OHC36d9 TaxID=3458413 RepID=UPI004034912C
MDFNIEKQNGFVMVQLLKEKLDTSVAPALKSELVLLAGNNEKNILLDLSKCNYCDSSGLSAILVANRLCKNSEGAFVLAGLQPAVEKLITVSQLDSVISIAPTTNDGIEMMRNALKSN